MYNTKCVTFFSSDVKMSDYGRYNQESFFQEPYGSLQDDFTSFKNTIQGVCNDIAANLSPASLRYNLKVAMSGVFTNVIDRPLNLSLNGVSTVVNGAGTVVTGVTNTVGGVVNGTLSTLNSGLGDVFNGLNVLASGALSGLTKINSAITSSGGPPTNEIYRYQSTIGLFRQMRDLQSLLVKNMTDSLNAINTLNTKYSAIQSNATYSALASPFQTAVAAWTTKLNIIQSNYTNSLASSFTTMYNSSGLDTVEAALNANNLNAASAAAVYSAIGTAQGGLMNSWNGVVTDTNNTCAPVIAAYGTLSTALGSASADTKNAMLDYMQAADAVKVTSASWISIVTLMQTALSKVTTVISLLSTEGFDDGLPYVHTSVPTERGVHEIYEWKDMPLRYVTSQDKDMSTHYYEIGHTKYYVLKTKNIVIEYMNTPYMPGYSPLQLFVIHVEGLKDPYIFSNYAMHGDLPQNTQFIFEAEAMKEGYDALSSILDPINDQVINPALGWISGLKDKAVSAVGKILGPLRKLASDLSSSISCVGDGIINLKDVVVGLVSTDPEKNIVLGVGTDLGNQVVNTVNSVIRNVSGVGNTIKTQANNIKSSVVDQLKSTWNNTAGIFSTTVGGVMTTIQNIETGIRDLVSFIVKLPSAVYKKLQAAASGLTTKLTTMGTGIKDRLTKIVDFDISTSEAFAFEEQKESKWPSWIWVVMALVVVVLAWVLLRKK